MSRESLAAFMGGVIMLSVAGPALASAVTDDDPPRAAGASATSSQLPAHTESLRPGIADDEKATDPATDRASRVAIAHAHENKGDRPGTTRKKSGKPDNGKDGRSHSPPAWAHQHSEGRHGSLHAWRQLTPEQRKRKMLTVTQAHSTGMRKWRMCTSARRTDCVRPLPPGLAKRR